MPKNMGMRDHDHAPRPQESIVINRNNGIGRCLLCKKPIKLKDGKWYA